jgi:hypothetical protein
MYYRIIFLLFIRPGVRKKTLAPSLFCRPQDGRTGREEIRVHHKKAICENRRHLRIVFYIFQTLNRSIKPAENGQVKNPIGWRNGYALRSKYRLGTAGSKVHSGLFVVVINTCMPRWR